MLVSTTSPRCASVLSVSARESAASSVPGHWSVNISLGRGPTLPGSAFHLSHNVASKGRAGAFFSESVSGRKWPHTGIRFHDVAPCPLVLGRSNDPSRPGSTAGFPLIPRPRRRAGWIGDAGSESSKPGPRRVWGTQFHSAAIFSALLNARHQRAYMELSSRTLAFPLGFPGPRRPRSTPRLSTQRRVPREMPARPPSGSAFAAAEPVVPNW